MLHLSEHHGDGSPHGVVWFPVADVYELRDELLARPGPALRPGVDDDSPGGPTLQVTDPYGNVLRFAQVTDGLLRRRKRRSTATGAPDDGLGRVQDDSRYQPASCLQRSRMVRPGEGWRAACGKSARRIMR